MTIFGLVAMSLEIVVKIFLKFSSKFSTSRKTLFDAKYFRYFCPSILCYIITTIPMIQMLMVHQYYGNSVQLNCTTNQTGSVIVKNILREVFSQKHLKAFVEPLMPSEKTQENIRFRESDQIWVLAYHQLFLFILVAGRAVMPRNGSYWIIKSRYVHHTVWCTPYKNFMSDHMTWFIHRKWIICNEPFKTKRRTRRGSKSRWEDPAYCRMHWFSCWYYRIRQWDGRWCSWPVVQWKFASKFHLIKSQSLYRNPWMVCLVIGSTCHVLGF